jgi:hypothetical protein
MSLTKVSYSTINGAVINVLDYGATGNGVTNDTAAIQAAINAGEASGKDVFIPSGDYLITGIVVYAGSVLRFDAAAWLNMSQDGIAIRSVSSVGGTTATGNINQIKLFDPKVDMESYAGFGILFECTTRSYIQNPFVRNISVNNYQYTDSYSGAQTYASSGIILKGITNVNGCFYNSINNYRIAGTGTSGGVGIWLGTSLTGNNQRPNFNQINFGTVTNIATGIDIGIGGDNYVVQPEVSTAAVGIRIGSNTFATGALRTKIVKPYLELNSTAGIQVRANATDLLIEQIGSFSGTTTPIDNAAGNEVVIADFRSGTYDVKFYDAGTAGNESPTTVSGFWTRSGSMVTVTFSASNIDTTGMTGGNNLYISLPLAPEYRATGSIVLENFTFPAGKTQANSFVGSAETRAQIYGSGTGAAANFFTVASISSGVSDIVQFSLTYICELPV